MIQAIYILINILIVSIIFSKRNDLKILPLIIFSFIFGGHLSDEMYSQYGLLPHEATVVISFVLVHLKDIIQGKRTFLSFTWADRIYFFYLIFVYIVPFIVNIQGFMTGPGIMMSRQLLPIKFWIIYRVFYIIIKNNLHTSNISIVFQNLLKAYIFSLFISGIIGMIRFFDLFSLAEIVNTHWPPIYRFDISVWQRLMGTVGGTNGGGLLFAFAALFSLYIYMNNKKVIFLLLFPIHLLFMLLTGSFSAFGVFVLMLIYLLFKTNILKSQIFIPLFIVSTFSIVIFSFTNLNNNSIPEIVNNRVLEQFEGDEDFTPNSFKFRLNIWEEYTGYFITKPFFGYGFRAHNEGGNSEYSGPGISESYFIELLMYSGIIGFFAYFIFLGAIYIKIRFRLMHRDILIMFTILAGFIISQISNMTMMYGGLNELFAIFLCLITFYPVNKTVMQNEAHHHYTG